MSDKRAVSTDALATLGTIITEGGRDAIHLAVEPVIAGEELIPGADIGLRNGYAYSNKDEHHPNYIEKYLGIVDPFLKNTVKPGEKFWLIVYPRQITSLRHVWNHPDFEEAKDSKQTSVEWMTAWAKEHMSNDYYGDDYDKPLSDEQAYANAINAGHNNHLGPYEGADEHIDSAWWFHWENITGLTGNRDGYFSCSC